MNSPFRQPISREPSRRRETIEEDAFKQFSKQRWTVNKKKMGRKSRGRAQKGKTKKEDLSAVSNKQPTEIYDLTRSTANNWLEFPLKLISFLSLLRPGFFFFATLVTMKT